MNGLREAGFSLGSNLGDRLAMLRAARAALATVAGRPPTAVSPVYETEPVGVTPEHAHLTFLNAVVVFEAGLDARAWLREIAKIETRLGRVRSADRNAPRPVDIDLLYCGGELVDDGGVVVPHPRWAERLFVLRPLADVRAGLRLPGAERAVGDALAALDDRAGGVRLLAAMW